MRKWIYTASFGTLEIVELSATQFEARYNGEPGNIYDSPSAAADDFLPITPVAISGILQIFAYPILYLNGLCLISESPGLDASKS